MKLFLQIGQLMTSFTSHAELMNSKSHNGKLFHVHIAVVIAAVCPYRLERNPVTLYDDEVNNFCSSIICIDGFHFNFNIESYHFDIFDI